MFEWHMNSSAYMNETIGEGSCLLIIDDEPMNTDILCRRLTTRGYKTIAAHSAEEGWSQLESEDVDVLLLDVNMPVVNGLEFLDRLRGDERTKTVPVIMVSALADTEHIVRGLQRGANDYVTKPVNMPILLARIETQLKIASLVNELESQMEVLATLATHDELTGVLNRRAMIRALEHDLARSRRYKHPLSVLMVDVDYFKRINDELGHAAGDHVLREFAIELGRTLRVTDTLCRYGGEEFCVILAETDEAQALLVAEHLRKRLSRAQFSFEQSHMRLTASIGVSTYRFSEDTESLQLLEKADKALYQAKRNGRNRVEVYEQKSAIAAVAT